MDKSRSTRTADELNGIADVVCVHGFWSHGAGMYLVKRRLEREYGMRVRLFSYPSVRASIDDNAAALAGYLHEQRLEAAHLVGHSLGGVVALRMFATDPGALPGRLVCMGSPLSGSRAAELLAGQVWAERIIGRSLTTGVVGEAANEWGRHVCESREVGVIAGTLPFGMGRFVARFDEPNDGTVAVSETRLDGVKDHIVMKVSHQAMLVLPEVIDQAAAFLLRGAFLRED